MANDNKQSATLNELIASQNHPKRFANLSRKNLQKNDIVVVETYIISSDASTLQSLSLNDNEGIGKEGERIIIALTASKYCNLTSLDLSWTKIGVTIIRSIGEYLISPSAHLLSKLNLSGNNQIQDSEIQIICSALSLNSSLTYLKLNSCNIGNTGARTLQYHLINYNSTLSKLGLDENNIDQQLLQQIYDLTKSKNRFNIREYLPPPIRNQQSECNKYISEIYSITFKIQINSIATDIPSHILSSFRLKEYLQIHKLKLELDINDEHIPIRIRNSLNSQISYLNELKRRILFPSRVPLMVLGDDEAENKQFIQHILGAKFVNGQIDGYDFSSQGINPRIGITNGIDVHLHQPEGKDFIMSIYDFSGKDINNSTYSFVLSSQAIYLLLFDVSKSLNVNRLAHWLHIISSVAPAATVFLVGTHFNSPNSFTYLRSNLSQLSSIRDNILFLNRRVRSLRIITPTSSLIDPPIALSPNIVDNLNSLNIESNQLSIWPISSLANVSYNSMTSKLIQTVTLYAEKSMKNPLIPISWDAFRSILYDPFDSKYYQNYNSNGNIDKLYSEASFKIGIMKEIDLMKYGYQIFDMSQSDFKEFIDLLEYWGQIKTLRSNSSPSIEGPQNQNLIILKPRILISLYEQCLPTKKSNESESMMMKLKKLIKVNKENGNAHLHILNSDRLQKNLQKIIPQISNDDIQNLVHEYVIPVFVELQLIFPLVFPQNSYIISAVLRSPPLIPSLINLSNHPLLFSKRYQSRIDIITMERRYEFLYLPDVLFERLMVEICKYFSAIPFFSDNLHDQRLFWENGFIIMDHPSLNNNTFEYDKYQICIIQTVRNSKLPGSYYSSIIVKVSSPISNVGVILPFIHRSIVDIIIQPLAFESGRNQCQIICSAITPSYRTLPPPFYTYDSCFLSLTSSNHQNNYNEQVEIPPKQLLPYLIPEYYHVAAENQKIGINDDGNYLHFGDDSNRYQREIQEIRVLERVEGGEVWYGYWHNRYEVAIKKPIPNPEDICSILDEIYILRSLHHPNLQKLFDVYKFQSPEGVQSIVIITEYFNEGNLAKLLKKIVEIHPILACCIVRDIAEGIAYLHNQSPPIVHTDLSLINIFIKSLNFTENNVCAVIGNVGYARIADRSTLSAGSKSVVDDVRSFAHILSLLADKLIPPLNNNNSNSKNNNVELITPFNNDNEGRILDELRSKVHNRFTEILSSLEASEYIIDTHSIATSITTDIINPFFSDNNNINNNATTQYTQHKLETQYTIEKILSRSPDFLEFQHLLTRFYSSPSSTRQTTLTLLEKTISLLKSQSQSLQLNDNSNNNATAIPHSKNKYWREVCRYVIPVIGDAIENHLCTLSHISQLDNLKYYYHPDGDFENGFTLFHYACLSANLLLLENLCLKSCSDINQRTYNNNSGSAAIHLAIDSLKHQSNSNNKKGGIEATKKVIDYLIRSQHANINLRDSNGETALYKAAMEGSFQLVVHLLNYPQPVDIHILSNENITAIVAAARYTPPISEEGNLCIKALLQMGSQYSRSLSNHITSGELKRIREIATQLITDKASAFARYPHATLAIQSWFQDYPSNNTMSISNNSQMTNLYTSQRNRKSHPDSSDQKLFNNNNNNNSDTTRQPQNTNVTEGNDPPREKSIEELQRKIELLRRKLSSSHSQIADFGSRIETIKMIERELEQKIIANFKTITNEIEWNVDVDYKISEQIGKGSISNIRLGKGSNNIGVYTIQIIRHNDLGHHYSYHHHHNEHYYAMKIVQSLISPELKDLMNKNPHHSNNHVRSLQYSEYWVPTSIFHPLIIQYVNYWIGSISENSLIAQHCPQIMNMHMIVEDALISHTSFLVMRLYSTTLTSYFASYGVNKFGIERKWKEISYVIVQLMEVLLHFSQHYVVHGDFRGDNILLKLPSSHPLRSTHQFPDNNNNNNNDDDGNNKDEVEEDVELQIGVTDFGFAKCQCNKSIIQNIKSLIDQINSLNQRYIPPELNKIQERYNDNNNDDNEEDDNNSKIIIINQATPLWNYVKAADIWSCGKMLLELFENNTGDIDQVLLSCSSDLEAITKLVNGCSSLPPSYRPLLLMLLTPDPEVRFNQRYYAYILSGLLCWVFFPVRSSNHHDDDGDGGGDGRVNLPSSIEELENVMEKIKMIREKKLEDAQSFLIKHPYSRCLSLILEYKFFCALSFFSPHQLKSLITSLITSQLEENN